MAIKTALTERFNLTAPIISAPMAFIAGGALAAAVSRAGGLGMIGGGYGDRDFLTAQFAAAGNTPVGAGFITWSLAKQPDLLKLVLDRQPRAVFLSFGELKPFAAQVIAAGIPLIAQVQSVAGAKIAAAEGASFIVAQGTEAGGHGAVRATLPLVPAVIDAVGDVPVLAAGGIADGRGLAAALALGAAGVVCGTAFFASAESLAHPAAKQAAAEGKGDETLRGSVFDIARGIDWPQPFTLRTLQNDFSRAWGHDEAALRSGMDALRADYDAARSSGDMRTAATIVGEAVDFIRDVEPAADIVTRMANEAEARLRALPGLVV